MVMQTIRARILDFERLPNDHSDLGAIRYWEDGAMVIGDGKIQRIGQFGDFAPVGKVIDYRPYLVMPGFIDLHVHMPQMQVIASYAAQLLDWLNDHTFPVETGFDDPRVCDRIARKLMQTFLRHGTTTAVAYCTSHPQSADSYFRAAAEFGMCMIGGKVMMDRGAPDALLDTPKRAYDETKEGIEKWHGRGRAHYAITPRFAITSTPEQLEVAQALAHAFPDCYVQTHINENHDEIRYTGELYPEDQDYMGIYERYELLGQKTLLGHCIHMKEREISVMIETGAVAVHCPTSNLFIGSGLFRWQGLAERGARIGLATDIGGGSNYSMLRTMDEAYKIGQLHKSRISPLLTAYTSTLGNAKMLGLAHEIGTLAEGTFADFIVLDAQATDEMALRYERVNDIRDELFLLQTLGDDRAIRATYVAGVQQK